MQQIKIWEFVVLIICVVGAINWFIVGLYQAAGKPTLVPDLFYLLGLRMVQPLVYILVGGSGIAAAVALGLSVKAGALKKKNN